MHIIIFIILALVVTFILPRPSIEGYDDIYAENPSGQSQDVYEVPVENPLDEITETEKKRLMKVVMKVVRKYRLNTGDMKIICTMMMADKSGDERIQTLLRDMMRSIPRERLERLKRVGASMQGDAFVEGMRQKDWGMLCTLVMARGGGGEGGPTPPRYEPPQIIQRPVGPVGGGGPSRWNITEKDRVYIIRTRMTVDQARNYLSRRGVPVEYIRILQVGAITPRMLMSGRITLFYDPKSRIVKNVTVEK